MKTQNFCLYILKAGDVHFSFNADPAVDWEIIMNESNLVKDNYIVANMYVFFDTIDI